MSSASTALLAALVVANGRPKRLLIQDGSVPFVSNIGRIAGATPLQAPPGEVDRILRGLIQGERIEPEHVWAVATHRGGRLAPSKWLSDCAPYGVSTIDVCLGSLSALAGQGPSASAFTIIDLDAEEFLAGVHLTALLTDDQTLSERVRQMCLPGPNDQDYVFDARPRGLLHDEAGLSSLVSRAIARIEGEALAQPRGDSSQGSGSTLGLASNRRFQPEDQATAVSAEGKNPWLALLSEDRTNLDRLTSASDDLTRRCQVAEEQALTKAGRLAELEASSQIKLDELLELKGETERSLVAALAEKSALAARLQEIEHARDRVLVEGAEREAGLKSAIEEQRQRALALEQDIAALNERGAGLNETWETSRAQLLSQIAQQAAQVLQADEARIEVLAQRAALEADLGAALSEQARLSRRLAQAEETRAVLGTRVDELQRESAALALKNTEAERALLQATQDRAREADAAQARLTEARASAEAALSRTVEGWRGRLEGAEQTGEALKTALAARASEVAVHERSHAVADAHRMALEEQVAQLHRALETIQQEDRIPAHPVVAKPRVEEPREEAEQTGAPDRALASWEMPRPRSAGLGENSGDPSSVAANDFIDFTAPSDDIPDGPRPPRAPEDAGLRRGEQDQPTERPRSDFTPEYEPERSPQDETGARARGWLRGMASRMPRG